MENDGNFLFRYRGQIPVLLFLFAIPAVFSIDYSLFSKLQLQFIHIAAILLSLAGFLIRSYTIGTTPRGTSGRNTSKQVAESLNQTGIYSVVRHPLYLGNYLMWTGIVLTTCNFYFTIIVSLLYWLYYERIMFAEERFLEKKFGDAYMNWSNKVPAFIPAFGNFTSSAIEFSIKTVLRREYSGILATITGFLYVFYLRDIKTTGTLFLKPDYYYIFGISASIALILRTLKRQTNFLAEEDRS